jgi:acyl-coenzyme A synthetase/AMP-(fatty) acid ligase
MTNNFITFIFQVSPTEIESVIQEHPDVHEVGVVGIPNLESTSVARAFIVPKAGRQCTAESICQFVAERLPSYKHLHGGVQFVDSLPESRGNKLDRPALKKMAMNKKI